MIDSSIYSQNPNYPTISVVIPVYNGAKTIESTLDSIFSQTKLPDEVIVVDDGSQDKTIDIVAGYNSEIVLIRQKNSGSSKARNLGIKEATGEFIAALDADDMWVNDKLEKQLEVCENADLVYTGAQNFGECERVESHTFKNGECVSGDHLCPLMLDNFIAHSSVLARREAILSVGGYDPMIRTAEDWDLWLRMAHAGMRFYGIPESKTLYRWTPGSASKDHLQMCKDRLLVLNNAIELADPQRVPNKIHKEALHNVWRTSAWFASDDRPKDALLWYLRALRMQPTSSRTWVELLRTLVHSLLKKQIAQT
ncbi:glycosyltransferase family 2 protein [Granulosicoccus sp.]|nr:glycosyltransferase family A protein [Granulosicoccus sp.]MDB4223002.1 glycosyltransferase family 2 protein [Granulosicoccus sp.]